MDSLLTRSGGIEDSREVDYSPNRIKLVFRIGMDLEMTTEMDISTFLHPSSIEQTGREVSTIQLSNRLKLGLFDSMSGLKNSLNFLWKSPKNTLTPVED